MEIIFVLSSVNIHSIIYVHSKNEWHKNIQYVHNIVCEPKKYSKISENIAQKGIAKKS